MKRVHESNTIENPFVKPENQIWQVSTSLTRPVSPPPSSINPRDEVKTASTAAVEAGKIEVRDHVAFFSQKLRAAARPTLDDTPRLHHNDWLDLYRRNLHAGGHHFVIHQHDHPVAGTHYDLRLQCNETSSISFAIMYGLPGDPNSRRLNRNATETRVHNLWNHLIETASYQTGTMLLWDTGEYAILPYRGLTSQTATDDEDIGDNPDLYDYKALSEPEKLQHAFRQRKIRIQLNGTRLPPSYTLSIRLTKDNYKAEQPKKPSRKRRKLDLQHQARLTTPGRSDSEPDATNPAAGFPTNKRRNVSSLTRTASPPSKDSPSATHPPSDSEDELIRQTNAYPGATNSIGSIHQRKWYLSMDRHKSGFTPSKSKVYGSKIWTRRKREDGTLAGFEKFHVLGRDVERSIVTGRLASEILEDEGVQGFVPRGLWKPVTE